MKLNKKNIKKFIEDKKIQLKKILYRPDPNNRYINIGGGTWYFPKWENVDYYAPKVYVDYLLDLRTKIKLPINSHSTSIVYSSHFFEHISDDDCLFVLQESYRILKKDGLIRLAVPDMDLAFDAYKKNDVDFFKTGGVACKGENIEEDLVNFFASYAMDRYSGGPKAPREKIKLNLDKMNKYDFCEWCVSLIPKEAPYRAHVNAYDYDKLKDFLKDMGFKNIKKSKYRKSSNAILTNKMFDNRPRVSLFIEAHK